MTRRVPPDCSLRKHASQALAILFPFRRLHLPPQMSRLHSRTSSSSRSIWHELPEDTFRQHLVDLERRTNAVPIEPQIFPLHNHGRASTRELPLHVEQRLADDLAFLAAVEEGAQSVAAVCLEQHVQPAGLTVRFAALDLSISNEVKDALHRIASSLTSFSHETDSSMQIEALFEQIVDLHFRRLLARLRSNKWEKPKFLSKQHKKPLWQDFTNLTHRVQFLYTKKEVASRRSVENQLQSLGPYFEAFEATEGGSQSELTSLKGLIKASYQFCTVQDVAEFVRRLEASVGTYGPTAKVASAIKCLRQIEKVAAYWRIAASLGVTSRTYPSLFQTDLRLTFLTPYESVPTAIGYEAWATTCHVHAEIQLAVYYDLLFQPSDRPGTEGISNGRPEQEFHRPRAIGTSKWLCYLCYLFLRFHGHFVPANTHGRLYDQWTIPDLAEYGDQVCIRYRSLVQAIDKEVMKEANSFQSSGVEDSSIVRWRAEPMTSRQNLFDADSIA